MHIITATSELSPDQQLTFNQGASYLLTQGKMHIAIWLENTPEYEGTKAVTIGGCLLEGTDNVNFLKKCIIYIKERHPKRPILGPMNGNTWRKHRLIIKSNKRSAFLMEPMEPSSLLEIFKAAGFEILSRYSSSIINLLNDHPSFGRIEKIIAKQGVKIRPLDMKNFVQDLRLIHKLSTVAFSNNLLYTSLPKQAFLNSYIAMKDKIDPDFVMLAFLGETLIGFLFCIPDIDPSTLIVKTLATSPDFRTVGLGSLLVSRAHQRAKAKGYKEAIHALQYENNSSLRISQRFSAVSFRSYGLMSIK